MERITGSAPQKEEIDSLEAEYNRFFGVSSEQAVYICGACERIEKITWHEDDVPTRIYCCGQQMNFVGKEVKGQMI